MQAKFHKSLFISARYFSCLRNAAAHTPVYPTANNSNGQITPQIYKTTIPVNSCQCRTSATRTADVVSITAPNSAKQQQPQQQQQHRTAPAADNIDDVTNDTHCYHINNTTTPTTTIHSTLRSSHVNKNHTTTTTTIEYELSNGVAKLCKISTSRVAAEETPQIELPQQLPLPLQVLSSLSNSLNQTPVKLSSLLSSTSIENLDQNLNTINALNRNCRQFSTTTSTTGNQQDPAVATASNEMITSEKCKKLDPNQNLDCATRDKISTCGTAGDSDVPGRISGLDRLQMKKYNKGLAFTHEERHLLGINGLLPAVVRTEEEQVKHCHMLIDRLENDLDKYMYLNNLAERNERLFYQVLASDIAKMMPLVYTPVVGLGCQKFSLIYDHPKGLYITIKDKGHIFDVLRNWPETDVRAIVVTDGERILGLGDLGANGMGIPVGKLALYTALAGIKPYQCLPITLDVGCNTQSILDDPLYIGLRQYRSVSVEYDDFIDEFMVAAVRRFGQNCLIQFEDFGNANAFRLLAKYRDNYCTFNDDIQGTAAVAVAGLLASLKIRNNKLKEHVIMFLGAGEAALGIANLCLMALMKEGLSETDAKRRLWMVDSKGLIVNGRPAGGLTKHKLQFAQDYIPIDTLAEAVESIKPTVLIGASAVGGAFTPAILKSMAQYNEAPIIFALSNPTSKAECTAEQAYTHTNGRCIFASGSPFAPVEYEGKVFHPGQGNNSYIFPGIALGVLCAGMLTIPEEVFLIAAERLAELCSEEDLAVGRLYPPLQKITCCSIAIAEVIMSYAYRKNLATVRPRPKNQLDYIKSQIYDISYQPTFPTVHYGANVKNCI